MLNKYFSMNKFTQPEKICIFFLIRPFKTILFEVFRCMKVLAFKVEWILEAIVKIIQSQTPCQEVRSGVWRPETQV